MTTIKKDVLENAIKEYIKDLGFSGQTRLLKELTGAKTKDW